MSADIYTKTDGTASMAYVQGVNPWHGQGQELELGLSPMQWRDQAGFGFELHKGELKYIDNQGAEHVFEGRYAIYRSDDGRQISIVSRQFKIFQPMDILTTMEAVRDATGWEMNTAGVLGGGSKCYALLKTNADYSVLGQKHEGHFLCATASDKSMATILQPTDVCVVCSNTLAAALRTAGDGRIKIKHTSAFDLDSIMEQLGLVDTAATFADMQAKLVSLAEIEVSPSEASELFADLLRPAGQRKPARPVQNLAAQSFADLLQSPVTTTPSAPAAYEKDSAPISAEPARAIRGLADLERSYYQAPGAKPGTGYGVVQGVTHWLDHVRGKEADSRMSSAFFGQGAALKEKAVAAVERFAAEHA